MIRNAFIAALLMGIAGCATAAPTTTAFSCAPEGFTLEGWTLRDIRPGIAAKTEDGTPQQILTTVLTRGDEAIVLISVGKDLILVDPAPQDKGVPVLINSRFFNADNELLTEPSGDACIWRPLLNGETT